MSDHCRCNSIHLNGCGDRPRPKDAEADHLLWEDGSVTQYLVRAGQTGAIADVQCGGWEEWS